MDFDAVMAAMAVPAAAEAVCEAITAGYNHIGPRFGGTTLNYSSAACAGMVAGGAAAALAWLAAQPDAAGELGSILGSVIHAIQGITDEVSVPSVGGAGGGTTSGDKIYTEQIEAIARSLRDLNRGVGELTLATAKAVAAACLAVSAYNRMSVIVGVPLGPGFCKNPTMPIFIVGADANEAAQHKFDAIFGHVGKGIPARPGWAVLNHAASGKRTSPGTKLGEGQNGRWYRYLAPCAGNVEKFVTDCDEYPYFSSSQGSGFSVPRPSIRPIDADDNQLEGNRLGEMSRRCRFESSAPITATSNGSGGTRYLVLPMPDSGPTDSDSGPFWKRSPFPSPFTFGLCNRGGGGSVGGGAS